jgi:small redox-active disulfide protein 2
MRCSICSFKGEEKMAIFKFGKKDESAWPGEASCRVKVLGSGCARCNQLEAAVKAAMQQLGMEPCVEHVTDFAQIAAYGVMTTPALVIDGRVVSAGRVLKPEDVVKLLQP